MNTKNETEYAAKLLHYTYFSTRQQLYLSICQNENHSLQRASMGNPLFKSRYDLCLALMNFWQNPVVTLNTLQTHSFVVKFYSRSQVTETRRGEVKKIILDLKEHGTSQCLSK